ncbi:MAG: sel1 repeat family protein [Bacteroidetes bacterium]|nr:MAG: sel1 repeat family protein [Bacteroidota bacterium]
MKKIEYHQILKLVLFPILSGIICFSTSLCQQDSVKKKQSVVFKEPIQNLFYIKRDNSDAELWDSFMLVQKANAGEAPAQHELGIRYLTGNNFFADTQKAVYWIRKAADQNLIEARYNYGILLNNGCGVEWNPFEAYVHVRYAAMHNMPEAQYVYGLLHTDNLVVARNYPEAYRWLAMAADSGYAPAKDVLLEFQKRGITGEMLERQEADSSTENHARGSRRDTATSSMTPVYINFSSDSITAPDDESLLSEALMQYYSNSGVNRDSSAEKSRYQSIDRETRDAIRDEAENGSPEALTIVARWHETGSVLPENELLASVYYLRAIRCNARWAPLLLWKLTRQEGYFERLRDAVNEDYALAKYVWAELTASGFDAQLTERLALQFLSEAHEQKYVEATVELGMCYYTGKWVPPDRAKGEALLKQAAQASNREAQIRLWMIALNNNEPGTSSPLVDSLRHAGYRGSVAAQAMLGYCYQKGVGVTKNVPQAVLYYRQAAERGSETAYAALKEMYAAIRPEGTEFKVGE